MSDSSATRIRLITMWTFDTQKGAMDAFGIGSPTQLKRYLNKQGNPSWDILTLIAEYGYNVNWLLTGRGSRFDISVEGIQLQRRIAERFLEGYFSEEFLPPELMYLVNADDGNQRADVILERI